MDDSLKYIARINTKKYPGVYKKIVQTVNSFQNNGYDANLYIIDESINSKIKSGFFFIAAIFNNKSNNLIIRKDGIPMLFASIAICWQRIKGNKVIIDIPTPIYVQIQEIGMNNDVGNIKKSIYKIINHVLFPLTLWPASKIIQYGQESRYFRFGLNKKTKMTSNGIDTSLIKVRSKIPEWNNKSFTMVAVASLAEWHGLDRVIKSIAEYKKTLESLKITLLIVGDGAIRKDLLNLANTLGVSNDVSFLGYLQGNDLDKIFEISHIGISTLSLYKKGMTMASDLKSREYFARGLPILRSGLDLDFNDSNKYVYEVPNDSSDIDMQKIISWYEKLNFSLNSAYEIRKYAEDKLDFSKKIGDIL